MKVYLAKYALTSGIQIEEAERTANGCWKIEGCHTLYKDTECFKEKQDAINAAEEMRVEKLKSLEKQMKKLHSLKFDI